MSDAESENNNEIFEDAIDEIIFRDDQEKFKRISLKAAFDDIYRITCRFYNNEFEEGLVEADTKAPLHFVYQLSRGFFWYLRACLCFEAPLIEKANDVLNESIQVCNLFRKKSSIVTKIFWQIPANDYTEDEIMAELIYGMVNSLSIFLTFFVEKNIIGLIKAAMKIRASNNSISECKRILNERTIKWSDEALKLHFESGVYLCTGLFNLINSHLPKKILRLIQLIGYTGDRELGIEHMKISSNLVGGLNALTSNFSLLAFGLTFEVMFGLGEVDDKLMIECLNKLKLQFNESIMYDFYMAQYKQLNGKLNEAIVDFRKCIDMKVCWKEWQHLAIWNIIFLYALKGEWDDAIKYAEQLLKESRWSPATSSYQLACFLYMKNEKIGDVKIKEQITNHMKNIPILRHRIAGKTVFLEKFAAKRSELYFKENEIMLLPVLELLYLWNIFTFTENQSHVLNPIIESIDEHLNKKNKHEKHKMIYLKFYKGVCFKHNRKYTEAIKYLLEVIDAKEDCDLYDHLPAHAALEIGLIYRLIHDYRKSKDWLNIARKEYTGYMNETMVLFRSHVALNSIHKKEKQMKKEMILSDIELTKNKTDKTNIKVFTNNNIGDIDVHEVNKFNMNDDEDCFVTHL